MAEGEGSGVSMWLCMKAIKTRFPKVKQLSTEKLQKLIEDRNNLVILDVRENEEYNVSHIPGVINILPSETDMKKVVDLINEKDSPLSKRVVVAYCSVGYRSSALIDKLLNYLEKSDLHDWKATFDLYNLEGSLFQWANEKRELVTCSGHQTKFVHPYNAVWGKLLDHRLRRNEPEIFDDETINPLNADLLAKY